MCPSQLQQVGCSLVPRPRPQVSATDEAADLSEAAGCELQADAAGVAELPESSCESNMKDDENGMARHADHKEEGGEVTALSPEVATMVEPGPTISEDAPSASAASIGEESPLLHTQLDGHPPAEAAAQLESHLSSM